MKNWILFFALSIALMGAACANKEQTVFEDAGKKADQGIQKTKEKVDRDLNKADEGIQKTGDKIGDDLNKAGEEIHKGFDRAGEKVKDATQ